MAPVAKKRGSKRFAEWEERPVKDFDPENEAHDEDESGSEESGDDLAGTEHYVSVGKSKFRKKDEVALGPEYRGARVSRAALEESEEEESDEDDDEEGGELDGESGEEEFDDPETADLEADFVDDDAEIDSDNAFGDSDEEIQKRFKFVGSSKVKEPKETGGRLKKRPTAADFMSDGDEEEEDDEQHGEEMSEDEEMGDSEDGSEVYRNGASLLDMEAERSEDDQDDDDDEEDEEDESDEDDDMDGFINDADEDDEDEEEEDEDEDEDEDAEDKAERDDDDDVRAKLKKTLGEAQNSIVDTMSQQAKADAAKGTAIRVQRRAFDSILNLRIRLQKALVSTNTFSTVEDSPEAGSEPYQAAEEAAVKLWNTIDSVRYSLLPESKAKAGMKRKRDIEVDTSSQDIWDSMDVVEKVAMSYRRKILEKWSNKVQASTATVSTRRLVDNANQTLLAALDDQMMSTDRLVKKVRTPRSCAPVQAAKKVEQDTNIYDDADFYQLLLKELVDQRSIDSGAPGESVPTVRWAALKEAKTRKQVDRKASKGRKLRFTVHEKLQNFMAPEDRRTWEEHAIDRFFGTLFGQKMELKEDDVSDEEMGGVNVEEAGLRLFQS